MNDDSNKVIALLSELYLQQLIFEMKANQSNPVVPAS